MTIILLNGTSSTGKTTISKTLQTMMDMPYLHVPIDSFGEMMPDLTRFEAREQQSVFNRMLSGFHHSVAALAATGSNLIVDHILIHGAEPKNWLSECLGLLSPFTTYLIGVRCPLEELRRRERERGNRREGQFSRVHQNSVYDLEVDTSILSAEQCAQFIKDLVEHGAAPQAAITVRQMLLEPQKV